MTSSARPPIERLTRRLIVVTGVWLALAGCQGREPEPEPVRSVRTVQISSGSASGTREFAADIRARTESRLSFLVGGKLVSREVELGQAVRAGQVIARLDPEDLHQAQMATQAALTAAVAQQEQAAADHQRFKDLRDQGFISSAELERRATALKTAQAQADQARAQAAVQRNQVAYTTLVAPTAGVVVGIEAEPGAVLGAGMPVLRLALDGPRDAVFAVPEDALAAMRELHGRSGQIQVRLWGSTQPVAATLRELAASADPVTRTYQAKADLAAAPAQLGQTAAVLVAGRATPGVYRLPTTAIVRDQDRAAVWLLDRQTMTVRQQVVKVLGAEGNDVLIGEGLADGMDVVTAGVHTLAPGQKVRRYLTGEAAAAATVAPARGDAAPRS